MLGFSVCGRLVTVKPGTTSLALGVLSGRASSFSPLASRTDIVTTLSQSTPAAGAVGRQAERVATFDMTFLPIRKNSTAFFAPGFRDFAFQTVALIQSSVGGACKEYFGVLWNCLTLSFVSHRG